MFASASRRQLLAEVQELHDIAQINSPVNLKHIYDSVQQLAGFGLRQGFPGNIMHHSFEFHQTFHFLRAASAACQGIRPGLGLVAGCPFAVHHAKLRVRNQKQRWKKASSRVGKLKVCPVKARAGLMATNVLPCVA